MKYAFLSIAAAALVLSACSNMMGRDRQTASTGTTASSSQTASTTTTAKPPKTAYEQAIGLRSRESAYGPYRMD